MEVFIKIAQFLLSLSILVILHELGHFIFARIFNTRVEKFYLFFDPWFAIIKFKKGETEYGVGWLPLGGYVKISGMIDESMDKEQLKKPPQPYEFRAKPAWQRLLIMLGGVSVNFLLALVLYVAILYIWGDSYLPTKNATYGIVVDSIGREMGLKNGDKILTVDHLEIEKFNSIITDVILNERKTIQVERDGKLLDIEIPRSVIPAIIKERGTIIDARIPYSPMIVNSYMKQSGAKDAGVKIGDEVVGINSQKFEYFDEYREFIRGHKGKELIINLRRGDETLDIPVTISIDGFIGIVRKSTQDLELKRIEYSFIESIPAGITKGFQMLVTYLKQFKLLFSKETKAYESLGGFSTIGSIFPGEWDWYAFWNLTAFLSIILAIMNVLPIPALDGGHVMFLLYEVISGRKPSDKFLEYAQITGMILLLALLIFANGNDIIRLFNK